MFIIRVCSAVCVCQAEELVKMEMLKMLHYDALLDCDTSDKKTSSSSSQTHHLAFLTEHPLEAVDNDGLSKVLC